MRCTGEQSVSDCNPVSLSAISCVSHLRISCVSHLRRRGQWTVAVLMSDRAQSSLWPIYPSRPTPCISRIRCTKARALCESGGGRPGLPVTNSPYGLRGRKALINEVCVCVCVCVIVRYGVCVCVCVCCLLYTSPSPRDQLSSRMTSSA